MQVEVKAAAYLDPIPDEKIRDAPFDESPTGTPNVLESATRRKVPVEAISNGEVVARQVINADGSAQKLEA